MGIPTKDNRAYRWVYKDRRYLVARSQVVIRDKGICRSCGINPGTECHHVKPLSNKNASRENYNPYICFSPSNMEMRCPDCHKKEGRKNCADDVRITADGMIIGTDEDI